MASTGLTSAGFVPAVLTDIQSLLQADFRGNIGQGIDLSDASLYGQLIGIFSERLADLWDAQEDLYASFNPDTATGVALDLLCALTGTVRAPAFATKVVGTLAGTPGTVITAGSTATAGPNTLALQTAVTLDGSGNGTGTFVCSVTGPVVILAGTMTGIGTPISGWSTVTNALDGQAGAFVETDAQLRLKRQAELTSAGKGTIDAIRAAVLKVAGVSTCLIFENVTLVTDGTGLPGKAFETLVGGSGFTDQQILDTIWKQKPTGIQAYGQINGTSVDSQGFSHSLGYSQPTATNVYLAFHLIVDPTAYPVDGDAQLLAAVLAYGLKTFSNPGKDVVANALAAVCFTIAGVLDAYCNIGTSASPTTQTTIPIDTRHYAKLDSSRITIAETTGVP